MTAEIAALKEENESLRTVVTDIIAGKAKDQHKMSGLEEKVITLEEEMATLKENLSQGQTSCDQPTGASRSTSTTGADAGPEDSSRPPPVQQCTGETMLE